ncbi:MAG: TldD/PmbA family protein, partial [Deltaproteobacteria bacterium]|nr:TldD/PmbA family protein [Deltaproteobacteria bacterium]
MVKDFDWPAIFKKALSRGGWLAEVFYEQTRTLSVHMEEKKLEKAVAGLDKGLGLRILFGQRTAYGYTTEISFKNVLNLARELSRVVAGRPQGPLPDLALEQAPVRYRIVKPAGRASLAAKADLVQRASRRAWSFDPQIRQVKVSYLERDQEVFIANSEGRAVEDRRTGLVFFVQAVAASEGVIQTGYEPMGGSLGLELFDDHPPEEVAEAAAGRAVVMLGADPAPGGRMPVVLAGQAGGTMIHEAVGHGLEADLAVEGLSV